MLGNDAHDHVIEAAGGKGNDKGDRACGVGLRARGLAAEAAAGEGGQCGNETASAEHGCGLPCLRAPPEYGQPRARSIPALAGVCSRAPGDDGGVAGPSDRPQPAALSRQKFSKIFGFA
jgi:hypothetical protein